MKRSLLFIPLLMLLPVIPALAQPAVPAFLEGTWKMENQEMYEHWELKDDGTMKGHSYRMNNGEKTVTENLEIRLADDKVIYTATVLNQNEGKGIDFTLSQADSLSYSFENPEHDFPKVIKYQKRSETEIYVQVSDGGEKGFAYVMKKQN